MNKQPARLPHRLEFAFQPAYWAARRLNENGAGSRDGVRDLTRRIASFLKRQGKATNLRAGKQLAREIIARAEQRFVVQQAAPLSAAA